MLCIGLSTVGFTAVTVGLALATVTFAGEPVGFALVGKNG